MSNNLFRYRKKYRRFGTLHLNTPAIFLRVESEVKMKKDNHIQICGWMLSDLGLKGNELIIYAIIFGFSQLEGQTFYGSLSYLAEWTNSTKQGVLKALKSLMEKGYIEKKEYVENNIKRCEYWVSEQSRVLNKVERGVKQSLTGGIKQSLTNNKDINNIEDNYYIVRNDFSKEDLEENKTQEAFVKAVDRAIELEEATQLARYLRAKIVEKFPNNRSGDTEAKLKRWAIDIDKMIRIDKRTPEAVKNAIDFAMNDNFWCNNIWSGEKLRKHYDSLEAKARQKLLKNGTIYV